MPQSTPQTDTISSIVDQRDAYSPKQSSVWGERDGEKEPVFATYAWVHERKKTGFPREARSSPETGQSQYGELDPVHRERATRGSTYTDRYRQRGRGGQIYSLYVCVCCVCAHVCVQKTERKQERKIRFCLLCIWFQQLLVCIKLSAQQTRT